MSNCNPIPRSLQKTFGERQCGNSSNKRKEDQQRLLGPLWDLKEKMGNLHSFGGKGILDTSPNFSLELQETVTLLTFPFSLKNSIMFWTSWVLNLSPLLPPAPHSYVPSVVSPLVWLDHPPGWSHLFHSSLHHHASNLLPGLTLSSIGHCRSSANPQMPRNPFNILLIGYQVKNKPLDLGPGLISRERSLCPHRVHLLAVPQMCLTPSRLLGLLWPSYFKCPVPVSPAHHLQLETLPDPLPPGPDLSIH